MDENSKDSIWAVSIIMGIVVGIVWWAISAEGGNLAGRILSGVLFGSIVGGVVGGVVGRIVAEVVSALINVPHFLRRRHLLRNHLKTYRVPISVGIVVAFVAGIIVSMISAEANLAERIIVGLPVVLVSGSLAGLIVGAILQFGIAKWLISAVLGTFFGVIGVGGGWSLLDMLGESGVSGHVGFMPFPVLAVIPIIMGVGAFIAGLCGLIQR